MRFKKPKNALEGYTGEAHEIKQTTFQFTACPVCKKETSEEDLVKENRVCPYCRHHFRMTPRQRLAIICDPDSFSERDGDLQSENVLSFPEYDQKLQKARAESGEKEAVVCGTAAVEGVRTAVFVMDPFYMMGSMGSVVGEKITRLFEYATENRLPVLGYTVSGGARMQEGILSLMQMAKTSAAVKVHSDKGNLFLCVLTDPTTGGVTASFAMEADIILAEPRALIGFAGPRVIEQTIRKKLPEGFQRAEFLLEKGFVDGVADRKTQKNLIAQILKMHCKEEGRE